MFINSVSTLKCPFSRYSNQAMSFRQEILLSKISRSRCIANLKELPALADLNVPEKIFASVLVPLCVHNGELCLLYTLRSSKLTNHSGQVSFPGGKRDNNETPIETALRETEEEIGFPRENVDVWSKMNVIRGRSSKMIIMPVVGQLMNFDFNQLIKNDDEVEEIFTVTLKTLCDSNIHAHYTVKDFHKPLPVFLCGKHNVWGISGMITHLLLQSLLHEDIYKPNFLRYKFKESELLPSKSSYKDL